MPSADVLLKLPAGADSQETPVIQIPEGYTKLGRCKKRRLAVQNKGYMVLVVFRTGERSDLPLHAFEYRWSDLNSSHDIIAYKRVN